MSNLKSIDKKLIGTLGRYAIFFAVIIGIWITPTNPVGTVQENKINLSERLPQLLVDGEELYVGRYRSIEENYLPDNDNIDDPKYNYWGSVKSIKEGFELLNSISELNPYRPNLYDEFVFHENNTRRVLFNVIMNERSDKSDIWWNDFDTSIDAILLLDQLNMSNLKLNEIDTFLDTGLELYEYYNTVTQDTIDINGTQVPA